MWRQQIFQAKQQIQNSTAAHGRQLSALIFLMVAMEIFKHNLPWYNLLNVLKA